MKLIKNEFGSYTLRKCLNPNEKKGTIVFIHGFATTSEYHDTFAKHAIQYYDYITIELPGHGLHDFNHSNLKKINIDTFVKYSCDLIKFLNIGRFYLIGHSMGGGIATRVANVLKDDVIGLVASTPMNSRLPIYSIFNYFKFNTKTFKKTLKLQNILYHDLYSIYSEEKLQEFLKKELKYQLDNREFLIKVKKAMFSLKNLKQGRKNEMELSVPTLAIAGKYDKIITPNSVLKAYNKQNDNIQVEIFTNSAHLPFQEEEEKYAKYVLDFFRTIQ